MCLTGKSTHNERIERMWRDIKRFVSSSFIDTFNALEVENMLDPLNEVDTYCLHFVFLPHINKHLADFQGSWNSHPLSTEGNMSPLQLFVEGLSQTESLSQQSSLDASSSLLTQELDSVQVPSNKFVPCAQLCAELHSSVDPMAQCNDFGKEFYYKAIQIVGQHLQAVCSNCQLK